MRIAAAVLIVLAALVGGLRLWMSRAAEDRLLPGEDIAIADLRGPLPANAYLACPPAHCAVPGAALSPLFALPWQRLAEAWAKLAAGEPRITRIAVNGDERRRVLIQHSALLHFPDIVTVEFVALAADRSSLALYSRARYGRGDFGVNRKRVETWLARLQQIAGAGR